jgi:hypothetical protein
MTQPSPRHNVSQPDDESIKLIPLTQGKNAIVDASDYDYLMQWNWCAYFNKNWYAARNLPRGTGGGTITMHVQLTGYPLTDHRNRDSLDNRRSNLRKATIQQNNHNRRKGRDNTSGFKGVSLDKRDNRWRAYINYNNKQIGLGYYDRKEDAAEAYDAAAVQYFGEFAALNFPETQ